MRSLLSALVATSLAAVPIASAASAANPAAALRVAPALSGSQLDGDNTWLWIGLGAVALGVLLIVVLDDDDEDSVSP